MKNKILRKMLSILILFMMLSQSLIPIILADTNDINQIEEKIENSINENILENAVEEKNNITDNIIDNISNDMTDEKITNNDEFFEDRENVENSKEKKEENILEETTELKGINDSVVTLLNERTASSVATTNSSTYFDSEYRLVF